MSDEAIQSQSSPPETPYESTVIDYKQFRICVGVPSPERTDHRFNAALLKLLLRNAGVVGDLGLVNTIGSRIAKNRNGIVENALNSNCTHIMWIDADSQFPFSGMIRLLRWQKDIVCATTCLRDGSDSRPLCDLLNPETIDYDQPLLPIKNVGFPFMLTKIDVFKTLQPPFFAEPPYWMMKQTFPELRDDLHPVQDHELMGEDVYFCTMARKAGWKIWLDTTLSMEIGHVGSKVYYIQQLLQPSRMQMDVQLGKPIQDNKTEEQLHREAGGTGE